MPERVANVIKLKILRLWLAAEDRDEIARRTGVGAGTVSNVMSEYKHSLASYDIEGLRELAMAMKNAATTPNECAEAIRMLKTLARSNVKLDDLQLFVNKIYKASADLGLPEDKLVDAASQLFSISKDLQDISVEELPGHVAKLKEDKDHLENEIHEFQETKRTARIELEQELKNNDATLLDLQQFAAARQGIAQQLGPGYSIIEDLPKLANIFQNSKELGYNASSIAAKVSSIDSLHKQESDLLTAVQKKEKQEKHLLKECQRLQLKADSYQETIRFYQQLREMGFGRKELEFLHSTLLDLVNANLGGIMPVDEAPGHTAVRLFFNDLKDLYAQHLTLKESLSKLKMDIEIEKEMLEDAKRRYADQRDAIETVKVLRNRKGFNYDDITYLESIIAKYDIGRANKQKFAQDLDKYGSIEQAIVECSDELQELKHEIEDKAGKVENLKNTVDNLEYKKDAIIENLKTHSELAQAVLLAARAEGTQSIAELTAKAQEGIETCRQLLQEVKEVSQSSVITVGKMNNEVMKQFEALSRLEGYKDFAEIIGKMSSMDIKELMKDPHIGHDIIMHTIRVLRLLISIYEQLGPEGVKLAQTLESVRSPMMVYLASYSGSVIEAAKKKSNENSDQSQ